MKKLYFLFLACFILSLTGFRFGTVNLAKDAAVELSKKSSQNGQSDNGWTTVKDNASVFVALPNEYGTPYRQNLSCMGWEDGVFISRDGLNLYCIYIPADVLSFTISGDSLENYEKYARGPDFGMDFSNPVGYSWKWFHGDILYAHRNSTTESFTTWQLSNMKRAVYTEGAFVAVFSAANMIDIACFTSTDSSPTYKNDIRYMRDVEANPSGIGTPLPSPVNTTDYTEDNPHIEKLDSQNMILFFDSNDRPGGTGKLDIWLSTSSDNGTTWSIPQNVTSINTTDDESQPHLYKNNSGQWYVYFSATNNDGKWAIFRATQTVVGDWNSWGNRELVIRGGNNTEGAGEPTLTQNGDISFVVVYKNPNGNSFDRYDADPWFLPTK
ncbi:MAG: sialidase family protein [Elusimicrobiota bacterium]